MLVILQQPKTSVVQVVYVKAVNSDYKFTYGSMTDVSQKIVQKFQSKFFLDYC